MFAHALWLVGYKGLKKALVSPDAADMHWLTFERLSQTHVVGSVAGGVCGHVTASKGSLVPLMP